MITSHFRFLMRLDLWHYQTEIGFQRYFVLCPRNLRETWQEWRGLNILVGEELQQCLKKQRVTW